VRLTFVDGTAREPEPVLTDTPKAERHYGSRHAFAPNGYLYVTTGDPDQPDRQGLRGLGRLDHTCH
jgi:glucose/arabinose dehydrogenase